MKLEGKTIWITGASSGIGEGMARVFHREGASLALSARREDELERVKATCTGGPGRVIVVPLDVVDSAAREAATEEVLSEFSGLGVLVNNAGISQMSLALETSEEVERLVMEVDYFAPVALTKLVLPRMIDAGGGHIVVTSSVAGKHAVPYHTTYCAAKHALHGYFDTLRVEHLDDNVDITLLVIAGVKSHVYERALRGDGSPANATEMDARQGVDATDCGDRVADAIVNREREVVFGFEPSLQALKIKDSDPEAFIQRMHNAMAFLGGQ